MQSQQQRQQGKKPPDLIPMKPNNKGKEEDGSTKAVIKAKSPTKETRSQ